MAERPQSRAQRKFVMAARKASLHLPTALPPVWFLTDPERTPDPVQIAAQLPAGWGVIYRHFGSESRGHTAERLNKICQKNRLSLLISADPSLAAKVNATGVHWPNAQLAQAKRWRRRFPIMTASAHTAGELRQLSSAGVDAALFSTIFPSDSPSARKPIGALACRILSRHSTLPVYGLGGVNADNVGSIAQTTGLASIDGILDCFSRSSS